MTDARAPTHLSILSYAAFEPGTRLIVLGAVHGNGRNYEGPMGKSDRALLFGALGALVAGFGTLPAWTWHIQPMACVLLAWTVVNRVRSGLAEG